MPRLALKVNSIVASFDPALRCGKDHMKTLETVLAVVSWIVLAIVLYALSPLLIKLMQMADHLNHLFGK
jgi:hypothetical protein